MKKNFFCFFIFILFFGLSNINAQHPCYQNSVFSINNQQNFAEIYDNKSTDKNLYSILGNSKVFGYKNENFYGLKKNINKKSRVYSYGYDYGYSYNHKYYKRENSHSYSGKPIRLTPISTEIQPILNLSNSDYDECENGNGRGHDEHGNGNGYGHDEHGNGNGYGHDDNPTNPVPVGNGLYILLIFLTYYIFFIRSNIFKNKT